MNWRILKFKPAGSPSSVPDDLDPDAMMRPSSSRDTAFFWDGVKAHELRIQRLADGSLRYPPVPAVWQDKSVPINYVVSSGRGTVFSFVVHHAPKVPGRTVPFVIALVELEEGVRMLGELRGPILLVLRSVCRYERPISISPTGASTHGSLTNDGCWCCAA